MQGSRMQLPLFGQVLSTSEELGQMPLWASPGYSMANGENCLLTQLRTLYKAGKCPNTGRGYPFKVHTQPSWMGLPVQAS